MPRPSATATASRFAAHWVADALAADDALDFSSVMALLDASPAPRSPCRSGWLSGACRNSLTPPPGMGPWRRGRRQGCRFDITRSCEDLLHQIIGEVRASGSLRKDMLPAFSQDIQNIIYIKKPRLLETCFELLREVDREIACMALPSPVEQNGDNGHDLLNIEEPRFPTDNAILQVENMANLVNQTYKENTLKESIEPTSNLQQGRISDTIIPQVDSNKAHLSSPQNDSGEKANQYLDYERTSIQPVEKDSIHEKPALRAGGVLPSVNCNEPNDGNCHLEVCCADKVNESIFSDGSSLEKNMAVCGGLNAQSASGPQSCSVTLHNKISDGNYLSEHNNAKRTTDVKKLSCSITVPISPRDGDERGAKQISNKETLANTVVESSHVHSSDDSGSADEMSFCIKDQGTNSSPRGSSEKKLCIKCGKYGQLLKCNSCLLAAHKSCFGPLVTFEDSGEFCCPVCFYTKATQAYKEAKKTYCEARKTLSAFLGSQQSINQHDEQPPEVLPRASPSKCLNGYNSVKRKNSHQAEKHGLSCSDEKADQQRKKQKTNATIDACHEETVTGKAPSVRNSGVEPVNKHSVLQNISKKVHDAWKEQEVENTEAREEAGNENSCDGTRNTSHEKFGPSATNECEADKEDGLTNCNQSENSGDISREPGALPRSVSRFN
uniref:Uncharacterized protein n=1 Tax=Avena sativa TaxID=4498 RepID=A0ACD5U823_AVESA